VAPLALPTFAAEFPNDNSELHLGTIWMCEELCGPAAPHLPEPRALATDEPRPLATAATASTEPNDAASYDEEPIEIVDDPIVLEGPIELVPAPLESCILACACAPDEPTPNEPETETMNARLVSTPPPPINDPFEAFLQTLSDVACESGQTFAASEIEAALTGDPVAAAWRAILNGESEDFSLCAAPLDEWASLVLAKILSAPHKTATLRRDLRAHGVAAFGLVDAA
jgi:hypothetical protein